MMCVQPLYFNEFRYRGLTGHKYSFFFACMCVILCAVVLVLIAKLAGGNKIFSPKKLSVADWAVLGFALVTLVSAILSPYKDAVDVWNGLPERHDGAFTQLFYVLIFLVIAHWYKPRTRDFGIIGVSAICIGLIGILQFYGMDFLKLWPNELIMINGEPNPYHVENFFNIHFRSTLGNVNMVATYVCAAILLCGFLYVKMDSAKKWRYVWLAGSAACFWLMLIGGSESGMVGVLVTMVLAIPFIIQKREHIGRFLILGASWVGAYTLQKLFYDVRVLEAGTRVGLYAAVTIALLAGGLALTLLKKKGEEADESGKPLRWKLGVGLMVAVIAMGFAGVEIFGRHNDLSGFYGKENASAAITNEQLRSGRHSMLVSSGEGAEIRVEALIEADVVYDISAWVRLKTPEAAELTLTAQVGEHDLRELRTSVVSDDSWAWLGGQQTFSAADIESGFISINIGSDSEDAEFYVDSFSISPDVFFTNFANTTWRLIYDVREIMHGRAEDWLGSNRIYIWQNALEAFPSDNPLIGSGPDTFWQVFPNKAEATALYNVNFDKAHNEYLQILVCQGILGLLSYLIFLGYLLIKAVPKALKNPLLMAVLAGFMGYLVQAFFNISLPIASQMLWVLAGVLAVFVRVDKLEKTYIEK